jgi:hypothetical protein
MFSMPAFFRSAPPAGLREYFERNPIALSANVDWSAPTSHRVRSLVTAVGAMPDSSQARIMGDLERIKAMADDAGQNALYAVTSDRAAFDQAANGYGRAILIFLNDNTAFRRAEEARFTDEYRRGRTWEGFVGPSEVIPRRDEAAISQFKSAVQQRFASPNVHIDAFDRRRLRFKKAPYELLQVTIYLDGRPDEVLEFVEGTLDRRPRRPVSEMSITYESATGSVEIVAQDSSGRADLARIFVQEILGRKSAGKPLPLRRYDLGVLMRPHEFATDPEDGIEKVQVNEIRLAALDRDGDRITLECRGRPQHTIWQMARERFGFSDPLLSGWRATRAKITIYFHPAAGAKSGRRLPVTVKMPHGCDLRDQTEPERIVGEKYLLRWGILKDV